MQTASLGFRQKAAGYVRPISWQLRASFDKTFDTDIDFFTLDTSLLDGNDVLAPNDNNIIALWDKYIYADYSDRVISLETTREVVEPYSIVQSFADITLKNEDDYFTPNSGSPIDAFILPKRPFRIFMGFGNETVPVFVGVSEKMPTLDKTSRTASFHLIDFLAVIFGKDVTQSLLLTDYSTSEILDVLFQMVGLLPDQYVLDDSFNRIPFFFVNKGDNLGTVIQELMKAEQGRLYLDELGIIRFKNRQNYNTSPVYSFDKSNTIDYEVSNEDDIINYVKLTCDVLAVQSLQSIWTQAKPVHLPGGSTVEIWANLQDPATSVNTPAYSSIIIEDSYFITTRDSAGTIPYTGINLTDMDTFGTAVKLTFENAGGTDAYIFAIDLWGTPVKIVDTILVEDRDSDSVDKFDEKVFEFETKYIQDENNAVSKVAIMIDDYKNYGSLVDTDVKGTPALQIDDAVALDLDGYLGNYVVCKVVNTIAGGKYTQRLKSKVKNPRTYFILNQSLLDGSDVLSP